MQLLATGSFYFRSDIMNRVNDNFRILPASYLFSEVGRRVTAFKSENPLADLIRMDIGDVTRPICPAAVEAMHQAVDDLSRSETFRGYGPEQGYDFLRNTIVEWDYRRRGLDVSEDEVFISDGAKSDLGNLSDLFSADARVAVTDPVYPVYVDTNVIAGRAGTLEGDRWSRIIYLDCDAEDGFIPRLPRERPDIIYLCFPNNPTGAAVTREQLKEWVDYARREGCLIIYDSAYEIFVADDRYVRSIYEVEGAREVAIEVRSFSKTAGFTGLRCGYTVVPKELRATYPGGEPCSLNQLWNRRQCTKFNGASYIAQCAARALYSVRGRAEIQADVDYYRQNCRTLSEALTGAGIRFCGGVASPYLWVKAPGELTSWQCFELLLRRAGVTCTPGSGFGRCGEGYIRFTAFNTHEATARAAERIAKTLK